MNSDDTPDLPQSPDSGSPRGKYTVKPKSNATKEIESWARSKTDRRMDYARQSGQLSDNVTEQRMLQSKIMELSKERYKFMSQNAYERKVFLDRQQRKTNVMKDLLKGIDMDKYVRRAGVLCSDMDPNLTPRKKPKKFVGRLGLLDRLDPTKKSQLNTNKGAKPEADIPIRPHTTMPTIQSKGALRNGANPPPKTANAALNRQNSGGNRVNFSSSVSELPDLNWSRKDSRGTPVSNRRSSIISNASIDPVDFSSSPPTRRQLTRANTFTSSRIHNNGDRGQSSMSSRSKSYPNKYMGPIADPRYFLLTKSLCDNYTPCMEIPAEEVVGVINKIDTLHIPARRKDTQSRPKRSLQLQEFMRERGLVLQ